MPVNFSVGGNLDKPRVQLDLGSLQTQLKASLAKEAEGRVKDEAAKAAKGLLDGLLGGKKKKKSD